MIYYASVMSQEHVYGRVHKYVPDTEYSWHELCVSYTTIQLVPPYWYRRKYEPWAIESSFNYRRFECLEDLLKADVLDGPHVKALLMLEI